MSSNFGLYQQLFLIRLDSPESCQKVALKLNNQCLFCNHWLLISGKGVVAIESIIKNQNGKTVYLLNFELLGKFGENIAILVATPSLPLLFLSLLCFLIQLKFLGFALLKLSINFFVTAFLLTLSIKLIVLLIVVLITIVFVGGDILKKNKPKLKQKTTKK